MSPVLQWIAIAAAAGVGLFALDRLLLIAEAHGYIFYRKRKGNLPSAGSVLLQLNVVLEPAKQYVIEAKQQESKEERDDGAPPSPGAPSGQTFIIPGE